MDALRLIFSFVGPKQYRFIAMVNRCFHETHLATFPGDTTTYLTGSTIKRAEICWLELVRNRSIHECALIASAASHGCMGTIRFLFERGCEWNASTCANAASKGHLHILKWCRENGCPWDHKTLEIAAMNGHCEVLLWCLENGCVAHGINCHLYV